MANMRKEKKDRMRRTLRSSSWTRLCPLSKSSTEVTNPPKPSMASMMDTPMLARFSRLEGVAVSSWGVDVGVDVDVVEGVLNRHSTIAEEKKSTTFSRP